MPPRSWEETSGLPSSKVVTVPSRVTRLLLDETTSPGIADKWSGGAYPCGIQGFGLGWGYTLVEEGARTQWHPKSLPGLDVSSHRQLIGGGKKRPPAGHLQEPTVKAIVPEAALVWRWPHIDALLFRIGSRCLFICKPLCLLLKILLQSRRTTDCDSLWDSPVYKHWSLLLAPPTLWDHQGLNTGSTDHSCNPQMNPPPRQETCRLGRASQFVCLTVGYFMGLFSCNRENSTQTELISFSHTHIHTNRCFVSMNKHVRDGFRHSWIQVLKASPESSLLASSIFLWVGFTLKQAFSSQCQDGCHESQAYRLCSKLNQKKASFPC